MQAVQRLGDDLRLKVRSRHVPHEVRALARSGLTTWERVAVRNTERRELIADFAVRPVWTLTETMQVWRESPKAGHASRRRGPLDLHCVECA